MGVCYPRQTRYSEAPFGLPAAGELFAWSRVLAAHEVLMALNTHGLEPRGAEVTIDAAIHKTGSFKTGSVLRVLYRADWSDEQLRQPPIDETVPVQIGDDGRAWVRLDLPPAGMVILG